MLLHEHLARRGIHRIPAAEESPYHEHEEEDDERQGIVPQAAPAPCPQLLVGVIADVVLVHDLKLAELGKVQFFDLHVRAVHLF